jgi:hypothetical protein
MADAGGVWRTVGGRRIFIKDGEDLTTAMKNSGKFKNLKDEENKTTEYETMMRYKDEFVDYIQLENNTIIARDRNNKYSVIEGRTFVVDGKPIPKNNKYMQTNSSMLEDLLEIDDKKFKKIKK